MVPYRNSRLILTGFLVIPAAYFARFAEDRLGFTSIPVAGKGASLCHELVLHMVEGSFATCSMSSYRK